MLKQCLKNLKKWKCEAELFLANAEELPFRDESFDVVFHLKGMNLFRFEQIWEGNGYLIEFRKPVKTVSKRQSVKVS